jgi:hypothetical protein
MKNKRLFIVFLALILLVIVIFFIFFNHKVTYPPEYKLNVTHVSDQEETAKYGWGAGSNCYLASTTMLLKYFDPTIEFWKVFVYQGNDVSFSYYWPNGANGGTSAGLMYGSTDILLVAASNLGFTPHVRIPSINNGGMGAWISKTKELGGDVHQYFFIPPMDEYKKVISSGIPIATSGSPCHNDYNVIEGYNKDKLFAIIPDPSDVGKTDPKVSCPIGSGLTHTVFWFTPDGKKISDKELILKMKNTLNESFENMQRYIDNLKDGADVIEFSQKIYLGREFASMYFQEQGYTELAKGYNKSTELLYPIVSIRPQDISKHKDEIISQMQKVLENEKGLVKYWNEIN